MKKFLLLSLIALLSSNAFAIEPYNPKPLKDDVIVSMPCGFKMAFRKVYTSFSDDKTKDASFIAGAFESRSPMAQNQNQQYVQGGFYDKNGFYYLISKYELLDFQYQALKNPDKCPTISKKNSLPAVNISWFDVVNACRNYSLYLQNAKDAPNFAKEKAFARLPSDEEWEFAARGGFNVSSSEFYANLPPLGEGGIASYAWFQGPNSANGHLQLPGLKEPNALGIFDMLGNAQEMILEPFKAVRTNRYLGQNGALCVRGGSFKSPKDSLVNSSRSERPLYLKGKENRSVDMGARLVLALSVASDSKTAGELNQKIDALGTSSNNDLDKDAKEKAKTLAMIDDLKKQIKKADEEALKNEKVLKLNQIFKEQLYSLRSQIATVNAKADEERALSATSNLRLGGFLCRSIAVQSIDIEVRKTLLDISKSKCQKDQNTCKNVKRNEEALNTEFEVLTGLLTYYGDTMDEASKLYSPLFLNKLLNSAKKSQGDSQALDAFIDIYYDALVTYPKLNKDSKALHKLWADKCYSQVKEK